MMRDSTEDFQFDLDFGNESYDPLEDFGPDDDGLEDEGGEQLPTASTNSRVQPAPAPEKVDDRPASERIAELFREMKPRRRVLLGILAYLETPRSADDLRNTVDELQKNDFSVFTSANYSALLSRAGAIVKVDEAGNPYAPDEKRQPEIVVVDGVEYLKPADPAPVFWSITPDGQAALDADRPLDRLVALFDDNEKYLVIYKRILEFCSIDGGRKTPEIDAIVNGDPLVQKPRLYGPHFTDQLEQCDALRWIGTWVTTDVGAQGLSRLADLEDAPAAETEE